MMTIRFLTVIAILGCFVQPAWAVETSPARANSEKPVADLTGGIIKLDETVISGNQELPKVLYILPWREPQGLPEIEIQAEFTEAEVFRRLYPPAYRRELNYFETLQGLKNGVGHNQED
ncbi:MAG: hypothetical protein ACI9UU_003555 [Candidatus Azotimanducaceae bacterium]|jgi:hypothetical protein